MVMGRASPVPQNPKLALMHLVTKRGRFVPVGCGATA
jgi:hypothetical protein